MAAFQEEFREQADEPVALYAEKNAVQAGPSSRQPPGTQAVRRMNGSVPMLPVRRPERRQHRRTTNLVLIDPRRMR